VRFRLASVLVSLLLAGHAGWSARAKGEGPTTIAAGFGSVWVGFGNGTVRRIDPRTYRLGKPIAVQGFVHDLRPGFGWMWAAIGVAFRRVDPRTNRVLDTCCVMGAPTGVAVGAGAVWVADVEHNRVVRFNPRSARVVARIPVRRQLFDVVAGTISVWAVVGPEEVGPRQIVRIDARRNRVVGPAIRAFSDVSLAAAGEQVWTTQTYPAIAARLDPRAGRIVGEPVRLRNNPVYAILGHGSLWVTHGSGLPTVTRIDLRTHRIVARIYVRGLAMAVTRRRIWVLDPGDGRSGTASEINPETNRVVHRIRVPSQAINVAFR
jgi:streptogramin lyase